MVAINDRLARERRVQTTAALGFSPAIPATTIFAAAPAEEYLTIWNLIVQPLSRPVIIRLGWGTNNVIDPAKVAFHGVFAPCDTFELGPFFAPEPGDVFMALRTDEQPEQVTVMFNASFTPRKWNGVGI